MRFQIIQAGFLQGIFFSMPLIANPEIDSMRQPEFMSFAHVGNPGEAQVDYEFDLGKFEVTNLQYASFLNSIASISDPNETYSKEMEQSPQGGIRRIWNPRRKTYSYFPKSSMGNKPVVFVTWCSAARFVNWMHHGRPSGPQVETTTESGAYTLLPGCASYVLTSRSPNAKFFIPNAYEMKKAGFWNPLSKKFWTYATQSNVRPSPFQVDQYGHAISPPPNSINFERQADWNGSVGTGNVTSVGSGGPNNESYYGTSDQMGNVSEWSEERKMFYPGCGGRFIKYGSYFSSQMGGIHDLFISIAPTSSCDGLLNSNEGFRAPNTGFRIGRYNAKASTIPYKPNSVQD